MRHCIARPYFRHARMRRFDRQQVHFHFRPESRRLFHVCSNTTTANTTTITNDSTTVSTIKSNTDTNTDTTDPNSYTDPDPDSGKKRGVGRPEIR